MTDSPGAQQEAPLIISDDVRAECLRHDVRIFPGVRTSTGSLRHRGEPRAMGVEAPAMIFEGSYDVDLIGAFSYLGSGGTFLQHVGTIGRFCAIATGVQAGHYEHPAHFLSAHPLFQASPGWKDSAKDFVARNQPMIDKSRALARAFYAERFGKIQIGNDVWIGEGVLIRRGVEIGDGAVIGSRAVVTRDVPPYAIVGGAPARVLRYRFEPEIVEELLRLEWWLYGLSALDGVDFTDIDLAVWRIDQNIASGRAEPYRAPVLQISPDTVEVLHFDPETSSFSAS